LTGLSCQIGFPADVFARIFLPEYARTKKQPTKIEQAVWTMVDHLGFAENDKTSEVLAGKTGSSNIHWKQFAVN